ncbi:uncharacterized protein L203_100168 [Cryptococcus depauperatus CBS 7841]|uniref:RlpA-like protein double-psi beta-barrel domain-containing protein n=1 Tax=Cryptococcus depauperatus CBS 7841 TaxID=1295531 RepID=A0AAJ8JMI3_9TREE
MVSKLFAATVVLAAPVESEIEKRATTYSKRATFYTVVITNKQNGRIVTAKVVNECPECNEGSLDMSPSLFGQLNDNGYNEEVFPITWYWKSD